MQRRTGFLQSVLCAAALAVALGWGAGPAHATLMIAPGSCTTPNNSNLGASEVETLALDCFGFTGDLDLAYKANVGGVDEGPFAAVYETTFSNTPTDPEDALIEYITGLALDCLSQGCFLLVKDGNQDPAQYLFNITGWDGLEDISLTGFWPQQGAISNIAIWAGEGTFEERVPEPGSLALVGLALVMLGATRRRR